MYIAALADLLVVTDFDGTLAPITERASEVKPVEGAARALSVLASKVREAVILTGRSRDSLNEVFPLEQVPGIRALCDYGADRDRPEKIDLRPLEDFREQLAFAVLPPGVDVEEKRYSLALHTRRTGDPLAALHSTYVAVAPIAQRLGLTIHRGRNVLDFSVAATTKSLAVQRLINEVEPLGVMIFGDDQSDIAAFQAIQIPHLTIGVISHEVDEMEYIADVPLNSPEDVVGFMEEIVTFTHVELTVPQSE